MSESLAAAVALETLGSYLAAALVGAVLAVAAIRHRLARPTPEQEA